MSLRIGPLRCGSSLQQQHARQASSRCALQGLEAVLLLPRQLARAHVTNEGQLPERASPQGIKAGAINSIALPCVSLALPSHVFPLMWPSHVPSYCRRPGCT